MITIKTEPKYLKDYIQSYYTIKGNANDVSNIVHRLPDGTLDFVINLGDVVFQSRDGNLFEPNHKVVITGLYRDKNYIKYTGNVHMVGAVFKPGFANLFVNDSLEYFQQCSFSADLIYDNHVNDLPEQLLMLKNESERHHFLEVFLTTCLKQSKKFQNNRVLSALDNICLTKGNIKLQTLLDNSLMSERTFRRNFKERIGMSPKQYSSIIRIKSFLQLIQSRSKSYAEASFDLGFTDQSHLFNEFKRVSGTTPDLYFGKANKITEQYINLI